MTHHRLLYTGATFDSAMLHALDEIFGEAWLSVRPEVANTRHEIDSARVLLALIIFNLARDGQLGALQITHTAARLMRHALGTGRMVVKRPAMLTPDRRPILTPLDRELVSHRGLYLRRFQPHAGQLGTAAWTSAERRVKGSITGADAHPVANEGAMDKAATQPMRLNRLWRITRSSRFLPDGDHRWHCQLTAQMSIYLGRQIE